MLLNIFFDNMNGTLELLLIGAFIFAIYWFILRKYNSLGLRMFVLCFLLFIASCTWIYKDEKNLKAVLKNGEEHVATILSKSHADNNNEVQVTFTADDGHTVNTKTSEYVSKEEWENFDAGKPLSILYEAGKKKTIVQQSIMRFKNDKIYLYFFCGFWLLLGIGLYIWLRKYKVGVDESGNEWVIREDGSTLLDERKSQAARTMKHVNIFSKMLQAFGK
jgi:hypothetical protein